MQPLHRAVARGGRHGQVLEWNDVWCREPAEAETVLREAGRALPRGGPIPGDSYAIPIVLSNELLAPPAAEDPWPANGYWGHSPS